MSDDIRTHDDFTHYVYRLFDADGVLLYIGCTHDVEWRVYQHRWTDTLASATDIQARYASHESVAYPSRREAAAAERAAIRDEAPLFNRQHNPSRWRRVAGQYVPVELALSP